MNEPGEAELDDLLAQATVDCYSEDEELTETTVPGVTVTVRKISYGRLQPGESVPGRRDDDLLFRIDRAALSRTTRDGDGSAGGHGFGRDHGTRVAG
jgi:hypothetical protein